MVAFRGPTVGIVGLGEVGTAFGTLYADAKQRCSMHDPGVGRVCDPSLWDVVHVCVPAHAVPDVVRKTRKGALVIVHSTVPVGTCETLWADGHRVVHAPVRGVHPKLAQGLKTFTMPLGSAHPVDAKEASDVLADIGIRASLWGDWRNTELAKLLSTTEYGWHILWMRHVGDLCRKYGADFGLVYREWHADYNDGYFALGRMEVMRPTLTPMEGPIGGHCVLPNARILAPDSEFAQMVEEQGREHWVPPTVGTAAED